MRAEGRTITKTDACQRCIWEVLAPIVARIDIQRFNSVSPYYRGATKFITMLWSRPGSNCITCFTSPNSVRFTYYYSTGQQRLRLRFGYSCPTLHLATDLHRFLCFHNNKEAADHATSGLFTKPRP